MEAAVKKAKPIPARSSSSVANSLVQKKAARPVSQKSDIVQANFFNREGDEKEIPQAKLRIGASNDKYEREADSVANKVVSGSANPAMALTASPSIQPKAQNPFSTKQEPSVQTKADEQEVQDDLVQPKLQLGAQSIQKNDDSHIVRRSDDDEIKTKEDNNTHDQENVVQTKLSTSPSRAPPRLEEELQSQRGRAPPMDASTLRNMSDRFGVDFSDIRIHNDAQSAEMSASIGAQAFTYGRDVYFGKDKYQPNTRPGAWLLAHELTHTLQQGAVSQESTVQTKPEVNTNTNSNPARAGPELIQRFDDDDSAFFEESAQFEEELESFEDAQDDIDIAELEPPTEEESGGLAPIPSNIGGENGGSSDSGDSGCPDITEPIVAAARQNQYSVEEEVEGNVFGDTWASMPDVLKEGIIDRFIDLALESLPQVNLTSSMQRFGRIAIMAFLRRFRNFERSEKIRIAERVGSILLGRNRGFSWGFAKGFLVGFFVDGLLGIIQMIIDIFCLVPQIFGFFDRIGQFINLFPQRIVDLFNQVQRLRAAVDRAVAGIQGELEQLLQEPERIQMILTQLEEQASRQAERIGENGANLILRHIDTPAERMGFMVGRAIGMIVFEIVLAVVLAALTAYLGGAGGAGSAALSAVKAVVRAIARAAARITRIIIPILRFIASKLRIVIQFIGSVLRYLTTLVRRAAQQLRVVAQRIRRLIDDMIDFVRGRRRRRRRNSDDGDDNSPEGQIYRRYRRRVRRDLQRFRTRGVSRDQLDRIMHQHRRPADIRRVVRSIDINHISRQRWRAYAITTLPGIRRRVDTIKRLPTGELSDPIPIRWYKPLWSYPQALQLTDPRDGTNIEAHFLIPRWIWVPPRNRRNLNGRAETREGAHGTEARIGIQPRFVPRARPTQKRVRKRRARDVTRRAERPFFRLLSAYGYTTTGLSPDHVLDLGFTGHILPLQRSDHYDNLWPLNSSVNSRSNTLNSEQLVTFDDHGTLRNEVGLNTRVTWGKWLKIVEVLHPKLKSEGLNTPAEKEADRTADRVVNKMNKTNTVQTKCTSCEQEESIQTKSTASATSAVPDSVSNGMKTSSGQGMNNSTKSEMESGFGADFSNVNIHNNSQSHSMNQQLGSRAFTHGNDIYFGKNEYNDSSIDGKKLIAHELTHTIQQGASGINTKLIQKNEDEQAGNPESDSSSQNSSAQNTPATNSPAQGGGNTAPGAGPPGGCGLRLPDIEIFEKSESTEVFYEDSWSKNLVDMEVDLGFLGSANARVDANFDTRAELTTTLGPGKVKNICLAADFNSDNYSGSAELFIPAYVTPVIRAHANISGGAGHSAIGLVTADGMIDADADAVIGTYFSVPIAVNYANEELSFETSANIAAGALFFGDVDGEAALNLFGSQIWDEHWDLADFEWGAAGSLGLGLQIGYRNGQLIGPEIVTNTEEIDPHEFVDEILGMDSGPPGSECAIRLPDLNLFDQIESESYNLFDDVELFDIPFAVIPVWPGSIEPPTPPLDVVLSLDATVSGSISGRLGPAALRNVCLGADFMQGWMRGSGRFILPASLTPVIPIRGNLRAALQPLVPYDIASVRGSLGGNFSGDLIAALMIPVEVSYDETGLHFSFATELGTGINLSAAPNASVAFEIPALDYEREHTWIFDAINWGAAMKFGMRYSGSYFNEEYTDNWDFYTDSLPIEELLDALQNNTPEPSPAPTPVPQLPPPGGTPQLPPGSGGGVPTGEFNDPIPFIWYKPWHTYSDTLNLTNVDPGSPGTPVNAGKEDNNWIYLPSRRRRNISSKAQTRTNANGDTEVRIGVQPDFRPFVGKKVESQRATSIRRRAQSPFRGLLGEYGFDWSDHEADHVIDLGFAASLPSPDHYDNMWPLDTDINQESNHANARQRVTYDDNGAPKTVSLNSSELWGKWLIISQEMMPKLKRGNLSNSFEAEADRMADAVVGNKAGADMGISSAGNGIQTKCSGCEKEKGENTQGNLLQKKQKDDEKDKPTAPTKSVSLSTPSFTPDKENADYIEEGKWRGASVKATFANIADGNIKVKKNKKGKYNTVNSNQYLNLNLSYFEPLRLMGLEPVLAVNVQNDNISGYATVKKGKYVIRNKSRLFNSLIKNPDLAGFKGLSKLKLTQKVKNEISGGALHIGVNQIKASLGGFLDVTSDFGLNNSSITFSGSGTIKVPKVNPVTFTFARNEKGKLNGSVDASVDIANFSGGVTAKLENGIFDVKGSVGYTTSKLSGKVTLLLTDAQTAKNVTKEGLKQDQILASNKEASGAANPDVGPKKGERALAGFGNLDFALTTWMTGKAQVAINHLGQVTITGEITPPAQITLFPQKNYNEPLFKVKAQAIYGVPYVANIGVFARISMSALAKIGPGKLYNIQIKGTYSTDPEVLNRFSIQGSLNISAYAGLRMRADGGLKATLLGHDVLAGIGVNADAGVRGYVEATPTIGYREKGEQGGGKEGEFFIKGHMEIGAQPVLGFSGDIFVELDSPWWSPAPDKTWRWPLGSVEYPLPGEFGIGADVDYVLGSKQWPKVNFGKVNFDKNKFLTDMMDENFQKKGAKPPTKKGKFVDKNPKSAAKPPAKKDGKAAAGKAAPTNSKSKKQKKVDPAVMRKWGQGMQALGRLAKSSQKKPLNSSQITESLFRLKGKYSFTRLEAKAASGYWNISAAMPGITNSSRPIRIKGIIKPGEDGNTQGTAADREKAVKVGLADIDAEEKKYLSSGKITQDEAKKVAAGIKKKHPVFKKIEVVDGGERWDYQYTYNPTKKKPGEVKDVPVPKMLVTPGFSGAKARNTGAINIFNEDKNHSKGTAPLESALRPEFNYLRSIGIAGGRWVKFHLINENLGGKGVNSNLVPLADQYNKDYSNQFETPIKTIYNAKKFPVWYSIQLIYWQSDSRFLRSINVRGGKMKPSSDGKKWEVGRGILPWARTNIPKPEAVKGGISIGDFIRKKNRVDIPEYMQKTSLYKKTLALLLSNKSSYVNLDSVETIINAQTGSVWTAERKLKHINHFNTIRNSGRIVD